MVGINGLLVPKKAGYARYYSPVPSKVGAGFASIAFGTVGRGFLTPFEANLRGVVDDVQYSVGGASAGSVRVAIYGPVATVTGAPPDLPDGYPLAVQSGSVAQGPINTMQWIPLADTLLELGLYFIGIQGSDVTGSYFRMNDPSQSFGRYFDLGAYGPFPGICPATLGSPSNPGTLIRAKVIL